jgi:hypothetical protein
MEIGELVHSLFDTAGPGGLVVAAVLTTALIAYFRLTRWILDGDKKEWK